MSRTTLLYGCRDSWEWDEMDKSRQTQLEKPMLQTVLFHPNWSNSTAGVRGTRVLNRQRCYWEITILERVFGTSMMTGIATKQARVHVDTFKDLLGEDKNSWGLNHKGFLWHAGEAKRYTEQFKESETTNIRTIEYGFTINWLGEVWMMTGT